MAHSPSALQIQCGVNFFILDSRRVLAPAPKVLGPKHVSYPDFAPFKKRGATLEFEIDGPTFSGYCWVHRSVVRRAAAAAAARWGGRHGSCVAGGAAGATLGCRVVRKPL